MDFYVQIVKLIYKVSGYESTLKVQKYRCFSNIRLNFL
jgi:hypothetical protein